MGHDLEATLERLRRAGDRIPSLESPYALLAPTFGPPCCAAEVAELDDLFQGALPSDYLKFLALCRGIVAMDVFNGYQVYSPLRRPSSLGIPSFLHVVMDGGLQEVRVTAVAGDGGGNQFLMGTSDMGRGHIWKWNHEHPPRFDGMAREGLSLVAPTFAAFLTRIADDWEHFVENDRKWHYLAG